MHHLLAHAPHVAYVLHIARTMYGLNVSHAICWATGPHTYACTLTGPHHFHAIATGNELGVDFY